MSPVRTVDDLIGPRPLPVVGNLVQMRTDRDGHRVYDRWAREYGPTYLLRFGKMPIVVSGGRADRRGGAARPAGRLHPYPGRARPGRTRRRWC